MSDDALRAAILASARGWLGTPYRHQASLRGVGCDCLGLVRGVWRETIGPEPEPMWPYSQDWAEAGGAETLLAIAERHFTTIAADAFRAGDVLLFRFRDGVPAKHVGIATGADRMIHAHDRACVADVAIIPFWRRRIVCAFRFPGLAPDRGS